MKKILIINPFGIGDVLFTTPLVGSLRAFDRDLFIGYVCNARARDVLKDNPKINRLFIYEKDDYRRIARASRIKALRTFREFVGQIKAERFDAVIDLSINTHASLLCRLIGIPIRIGYNYKNRSPFLTVKPRLSGYEGRHVAEHYLSLLESLGVPPAQKHMEVFIAPEDRQWQEAFFEEHRIKADETVMALIPGGGASWGPDAVYRRWPAKDHAALADRVLKNFPARIILLGDPSETVLTDEIMQTTGRPDLVLQAAGRTTIGQYLAVLSRCRLAIVNDGGPLHMAVAAGTRTLSLIGPVDEHVYGPYPPDGHAVVTADIPCRPCYRNFRRADCPHFRCLRDITVEKVYREVEGMLKTIRVPRMRKGSYG